MPRRERTSIGLPTGKMQILAQARERYEEYTGKKTDWGNFLAATVVLGLAALGIYRMINSSKKNPTATCVVCHKRFSIAHSGELSPVVYVTCPNCGAELVVAFTEH